ncbi:hypothetical protein RHGRI_036852 [Rhododendron griersonianum]|uniref:N-acetyl-D-glucosamine kinase n=1 Tax=Rhododendron griersonianum TaxID=479676 RepID=A0AAV6HQM8_9ERIC|nr:hypothetical protein RHGRI_036852 [Rhododendron griersonianum]
MWSSEMDVIFDLTAGHVQLLNAYWSLIADGNGSFPVVMVGGVLEANKKWDIGKEVAACIQKTYPKASPIRPKVEPAVGAALLAWNSLMKETSRLS